VLNLIIPFDRMIRYYENHFIQFDLARTEENATKSGFRYDFGGGCRQDPDREG
jgi:hypothetical protein